MKRGLHVGSRRAGTDHKLGLQSAMITYFAAHFALTCSANFFATNCVPVTISLYFVCKFVRECQRIICVLYLNSYWCWLGFSCMFGWIICDRCMLCN